MTEVTETSPETETPPAEPSRRDFLFIATGAMALVGTAATIWPFISEMSPDAGTIAAGGPLDVDLSAIAAGQQIVVVWRGHPIFVVNRPPAALATLQEPELVAKLADPEFKDAPAAALRGKLASVA